MSLFLSLFIEGKSQHRFMSGIWDYITWTETAYFKKKGKDSVVKKNIPFERCYLMCDYKNANLNHFFLFYEPCFGGNSENFSKNNQNIFVEEKCDCVQLNYITLSEEILEFTITHYYYDKNYSLYKVVKYFKCKRAKTSEVKE